MESLEKRGVDWGMPEQEENLDQLGIYKRGMSALIQKNKELLTQIQELCTEKDSLQSQNQELCKEIDGLRPKNQELSTQCADLLAKEQALTKSHRIWRGVLLAAVLAMTIAAVCFYTRMEQFSDRYDSEQEQREEAEMALSAAQNAKTEAEMALSVTQDAKAEAEDTLNELYSGLADAYENTYGYASDSFYAKESVMVLSVGQTETLHAYNAQSHMHAVASDEEALSIGSFRTDAYRPEIKITAHQPGVFTVNCAAHNRNHNFLESFDVLVVVVDWVEISSPLLEEASEETP